jgi:DNA (cytosine-5)-methyltransferase 1
MGKIQRRLTVRECARLQTLPDDYDFVIPEADNSNRFKVSSSQAYKLIGNAVPPLLAYFFAQNFNQKWKKWFING